MTAEIVSVGTELLMGQIADTDAQHLGRTFPEFGIDHYFRQTVGDNLERLTSSLRLALSRADIVFTVGGLGPTQDDLTRDGVAAALSEPLVQDPEMVRMVVEAFSQRKIPVTDTQMRQSYRPACGRAIENPNGTAPGIFCQKSGKTVISLPGPRGEFIPMVEGFVRDFLAGLRGGEVIHSRILRVCGIGESAIEDKVRHLIDCENPSVAPYAQTGEVFLRLTAKAATTDAADKIIDPVDAEIRRILGDAVYATGASTLEQAVIELLKERDETVSVAESITGGWLGQRFTSVSGSGDVFVGGVISYRPTVKENLLDVDGRILEDPQRGPVDPEVARQMAEGIRQRLNATYGVSLTGNAGPKVDAGGKPVGLVYMAVAWDGGFEIEERTFKGLREDVRLRSTQVALTLLRNVILRRRRAS